MEASCATLYPDLAVIWASGPRIFARWRSLVRDTLFSCPGRVQRAPGSSAKPRSGSRVLAPPEGASTPSLPLVHSISAPNHLIAKGLVGDPTAPVMGIAGATNMNS